LNGDLVWLELCLQEDRASYERYERRAPHTRRQSHVQCVCSLVLLAGSHDQCCIWSKLLIATVWPPADHVRTPVAAPTYAQAAQQSEQSHQAYEAVQIRAPQERSVRRQLPLMNQLEGAKLVGVQRSLGRHSGLRLAVS
jgi:hypothetical protein